MKVLTTLTVSGGLNMASTAKDVFTIGTPLENNDGNVDDLYVYANADFKNNVILGSSSVDTLVVNALVSSSIIPAASGTFSLGSPNNPFKEIYVGSGSISIASPLSGIAATTISNNSGNLDISAGGVRLIGTGSFIGNGSQLTDVLASNMKQSYVFLTTNGQSASFDQSIVYLDDGNNAHYGLPDIDGKDGHLITMKNLKNSNATIHAYTGQTINGNATYTIAGNSTEMFHAVSSSNIWYTILSTLAFFVDYQWFSF